ncbi:MAG: FAD-dependent oxidoreductase, partial [Akkermansiaceae bacterium]
MKFERKKIAIVGSGISGMACAHFLHPHHDITLFEKDDRIGGHSNTVIADKDPIDTGFMVYNEVTYPLLTKLFKDLGVETKSTSMSFSVQHTADKLEFNGGSLNLLFGQRRNLLRPRFWKMLMQINRFNKETVAELQKNNETKLTLAEYVEERGYGRDFLKWYLSPMAAAVWSSPPEKIEQFPAITLMRFWHNHG